MARRCGSMLIEEKLASRAEHAIALWTRYLTVNPDDMEEQWDGEIRPIRLALRITSQCINVHPSLESATTNLFNQLYAHHGIVSKQPRVIANRHRMINRNDADMTYKSAIMKMPGQMKVMEEAFRAITSVMSRVSTYVNEWMRYQVLWDLRMEHVCDRLENDLDKWIRTLAEIRDTRKRLDDEQTMEMNTFPVFVDYNDVQHMVSVKHEYWLRELQQKFVVILGDSIKNFYSDIAKWNLILHAEITTFEETNDGRSMMKKIEELKMHVTTYDEEVSRFRLGELLLASTHLPLNWIHADETEKQFRALMETADALVSVYNEDLRKREENVSL
ncbi:hypothetical protein M3Y95_00714800 [Aphelenchoides besseyi]|nr:hypothetical protein M3Y95_00714800 [Aphelenchoides besseyi]